MWLRSTLPSSMAASRVLAPCRDIANPVEPFAGHDVRLLPPEHQENQMMSPMFSRWASVHILSRSATFLLSPSFSSSTSVDPLVGVNKCSVTMFSLSFPLPP